MKQLFITIFIILISNTLFSQSYYRVQDKKINLKADTTAYIIQTDKRFVEKCNSTLKEQLQKEEFESFQKISNNRFLIVGAKSQPRNYSYTSNIYRNDKNEIVIIYPRIVIMLKENDAIHSILDKYNGTLVKENDDKQKYILKCNVSQSEKVLQLVNELDSMKNVEWCEPEFFVNYKTTNTLYSRQYYLNNTGQNGGTVGIDINAPEAWEITEGCKDIVVAVIAQRVDLVKTYVYNQ